MGRYATRVRRCGVLFTVSCTLTMLLAAPHAALAQNPGPGIGAVRHANGLQLSFHFPDGPLFLRELLPVTVSLTNHSPTVVMYWGWPVPTACRSGLVVVESGGMPPLYNPPVLAHPHCPGPPPRKLGQGRTLTLALLVPLTASGRVTLSAQAEFVSTARRSGGGTSLTGGPGPFASGWPSLNIHVSPHAPANRLLHLRRAGARVYVTAPPGASSHLVYQVSATCSGGATGNPDWQPLTGRVIDEPGCPGSNETWAVLVGAPGYAIASAVYRG
jgi:hypothetical protein